jgi:hypothetical protein
MHDSWNHLIRMAAAVAARWRAQLTRIRVAPFSAEWLRVHEIEANKHADG